MKPNCLKSLQSLVKSFKFCNSPENLLKSLQSFVKSFKFCKSLAAPCKVVPVLDLKALIYPDSAAVLHALARHREVNSECIALPG